MLGLVGLYLGACIAFGERLIHPAGPDPARPVGFAESRLGGVACWTLPSSNRDVTFVFVHGLKGSRAHWVNLMKALQHHGYASVSVPLPGHSGSDERVCTVGPRERDTVIAVCKAIREKDPKMKIVLSGVSLGGAACWLAAESDKEIADAIFTESAFASLPPAIDHWFDRVVPLGHVILRPVIWWAQFRTGTQLSEVHPVRGAAAWRHKPAIVAHVVGDSVIQEWHGQHLSKAVGVELWRIEGVDHSTGVSSARAEYLARLIALAETVSN